MTTETLPTHSPETTTLVEQNEALLSSVEAYGPALVEAYHGAVEFDSQLAGTEIVSLADDEKRVARAVPKWSKQRPSGLPGEHHEAHILTGEIGSTLDKFTGLMQNHPDLVSITSQKLKIAPEQVTPQLLYVYAFLHEFGHIHEYSVYDEHPEHFSQKNTRERAGLPVPFVTPSALADPRSQERQDVDSRWEGVRETTGAADVDDLIARQTRAYRNVSSERHADDFAAEVLLYRKPDVLSRLVL